MRAGCRSAAGADSPPIPAAAAEASLLGQVALDLPAEPDRAAAKLGNRAREVRMPAATEREGGPPDAGKLGGLRQPYEVKRKDVRRLFCRFGSYRARFWLGCAHLQLM